MKLAVVVAALLTPLVAGSAASQMSTEPLPRLICLSAGETRDLFVADKLVQPFRVMREASRITQAEAIDIQLCRTQGALVYDVTLLDRTGRVMHKLVSASNGAALNEREKGSLPRAEPSDRAGGPKPADHGGEPRILEQRGN